jgi:pyridoxine kinase
MGAQKIIVISSHVAAGAVGARAAGFGLERLGFEAVLVPTVILPWHPGQGRGTRVEPPAEAFAALLADLAGAPWLASVAGMLTGYFGNAGQVTAAARLTRAVRAANPSALVVCDPVSGDGGALFVAEAIAAAIRDDLAPLADALTPNRFELGWLTRSGATDNAGLGEAARQLGARETVVTSAFAPPGEAGALIVAGGESHLATHRAVPGAPHGTGDLFAALYLAHRLRGRAPVAAAREGLASVSGLTAMAAQSGADALPLAAGQQLIAAPPGGVTVRPL